MTSDEAGFADLDDLARLFGGYLEFYRCPTDRASVATFVEALLRQRTTRFFLARRAGLCVGFAHMIPTFDTLALRHAWILQDFFVEPQSRRSGAGSALLRCVETFARSDGASRISLSTAHTNATAQRLYAAAGYAHDEVFRTYDLLLR